MENTATDVPKKQGYTTIETTVAWYRYATPFLFNVPIVFLIGEESDGGHRTKRVLYIGIKRLWLWRNGAIITVYTSVGLHRASISVAFNSYSH